MFLREHFNSHNRNFLHTITTRIRLASHFTVIQAKETILHYYMHGFTLHLIICYYFCRINRFQHYQILVAILTRGRTRVRYSYEVYSTHSGALLLGTIHAVLLYTLYIQFLCPKDYLNIMNQRIFSPKQ